MNRPILNSPGPSPLPPIERRWPPSAPNMRISPLLSFITAIDPSDSRLAPRTQLNM